MAARSNRARERQPLLWLLIGWLAFVFLVGGSSRADTTSLLALRPLAIFMCGIALIGLTQHQYRMTRAVLLVAAATFALLLAHLVPLPPALWQMLPQRDLIAEIDRAFGLPEVWRPLSIAPPRTLNALFSLFVPLSVLSLMARLNPDHADRRLLATILALAAGSSVLGMLQLSTGENGALYPYRIDNAGSPIGFFSNRNHQAAFLASCLPLIAAFACGGDGREDRVGPRRAMAAALGLVVLLLLVILGSRAGLVCGVAGLGAGAFIFWRGSGADLRKRATDRRWLALGATVIVAGLVAIAMLSSRAESIARLVNTDNTTELRFNSFETVSTLVVTYLPFGSGIGTFVEAYQRAEPTSLLQPQYLNHAHNDYLEWLVTGGVPAALILGWIGILMFRAARRTLTRGPAGSASGARPLSLAALASLAVLAIASVFDYPLRTPAMMAYAAMLLSLAVRSTGPDRGVA